MPLKRIGTVEEVQPEQTRLKKVGTVEQPEPVQADEKEEERPGALKSMWEGYKTGASLGLETASVPVQGIAGLSKYISESLRTGSIDKGLEAAGQTMEQIQQAAANLIPTERGKQEVGKVIRAGMEVPGVTPTAQFVGKIPERIGDVAMKGAEMAGVSPGTASSLGAMAASALPGALEIAGGMSTLRSAKGLVGTGADAARAARQGVEEVERFGTRVATSDVLRPQSRAGKLLERGAESGLGPSAKYRAKQQAERVEMIKDFARQYGAEDAAPYIDEVYKDLDKTWNDKINRFATEKKEVINRLDAGNVVPVNRTMSKIDSEINRLKVESPSGANDALIKELENFKTDIDGQGLINIEAARKRLGNNLAQNKDLAHIKDEGQKIAGSLYKDLNDEMGDFIRQQGGDADFTKWKAANTEISKLNDNLKFQTLRSVLSKGRQTPEDVRRLLMSAKPSEVKMLYKNLSPQGRKNAQMALIQEAVEKTGGFDEFTPDKFKNQLKRMRKQTGVFFTGEDEKAIEGIYRALKMTEKAGEATAAPMTGLSNLPYVTTVLGGVMGGFSGAGGLGTAAGAAALPLSLSVASRVYNSKPVRNALIKIAYSKPGTVQEIENMKKLAATLSLQKDNIERIMEKQKGGGSNQ